MLHGSREDRAARGRRLAMAAGRRIQRRWVAIGMQVIKWFSSGTQVLQMVFAGRLAAASLQPNIRANKEQTTRGDEDQLPSGSQRLC